MNFKKDIAGIYEEIFVENYVIEEGSHGDKRALLKLLKGAIKRGLVRVEDTKSGYMVKSLVDDSQYLTHKGEKGLHDLRRYLQRLERVTA